MCLLRWLLNLSNFSVISLVFDSMSTILYPKEIFSVISGEMVLKAVEMEDKAFEICPNIAGRPSVGSLINDPRTSLSEASFCLEILRMSLNCMRVASSSPCSVSPFFVERFRKDPLFSM